MVNRQVRKIIVLLLKNIKTMQEVKKYASE